jgi:hypothetical protein
MVREKEWFIFIFFKLVIYLFITINVYADEKCEDEFVFYSKERIVLYNYDKNDVSELIDFPVPQYGFDVFPNKKQIVFVKKNSENPLSFDLYLMDLTTHRKEILTTISEEIWAIRISPDGKKAFIIPYTPSAEHGEEIFLFTFDERKISSLFIFPSHDILWSPTSDMIVLTQDNKFYIMGLDGKKLKEIFVPFRFWLSDDNKMRSYLKSNNIPIYRLEKEKKQMYSFEHYFVSVDKETIIPFLSGCNLIIFNKEEDTFLCNDVKRKGIFIYNVKNMMGNLVLDYNRLSTSGAAQVTRVTWSSSEKTIFFFFTKGISELKSALWYAGAIRVDGSGLKIIDERIAHPLSFIFPVPCN